MRIVIYNNPFFEKDQFFRILLHKVCIYFDLSRIICSRPKERMGVKAHFFCTEKSPPPQKNHGSFYQKQRVVLLKTTARFIKNNVSVY